jgi:PGF-pre-PGF domain-containing protein
VLTFIESKEYNNMKRHFTVLISMLLFFSFGLVEAQPYLNENATWQQNLTDIRWSNIVLGDLDNDNNLDLVLFGCLSDGANDCENGMIAKIYINNGTSLIENLTWQQNLTAVSWGSVALGDIDNDGDLDLAASGCGLSKYPPCDNIVGSKIYTNNGTSLIENLTWQQNLTAVSWGSVALGDIDNDGDLDLGLSGIGSVDYISKIYINNGTSLVENQAWQQNLTPVGRSSIAFIDIDNDRDLDMDLNGFDDSVENAKVYINNGTSLVENQAWQQNIEGWGFPEISYGDFDNDGITDCVRSGAMAGDHLYIYRNNGSTIVVNQTGIGDGGDYLVGFFDGSLAWGDIDNDGDLDLVGMGSDGEGGRSRIYDNNNNIFVEYTTAQYDFKEGFRQGSLAWGDIDNDGDLDLVVSGLDFTSTNLYSRIYTNNITTPNTIPDPPTDSFVNTYTNNQLFLSWGNGSDTETNISGLYYNLRVGTSSAGNHIVSGVYGGSSNPTGGYFGNMMQRKSITLNVGLEPNETIYWAVQTIDTGLAKSSWSVEQNYTVPWDSDTPVISLNSPLQSYNTSNISLTFNATVHDDVNLVNVSLWANWGGGWELNGTNSSGVNDTDYVFIRNLSSFGLGDGEYSLRIQACDNSSNCINSSLRTFRIDTVYPVVALVSPASGSTWTSSSTVTFTYNVSDAAVRNCSLIINDATVSSDASVTVNASQTFSRTLSNGNYQWYVNCTDYVNFTNSSATRTLTVSYTAPTNNGNNGGSGGGPVSSGSSLSQTVIISPIMALSEGIARFTKPALSVIEIAIVPNRSLSNVRLSVEKLSEKPDNVSLPEGQVYVYMEIGADNLLDNDIENASITFRVNRSWVEDNKINKTSVRLLRHFEDAWQELVTSLVNETADYVYEAVTPGFSYFSVVGNILQTDTEICNNNGICEAGLGEDSTGCPEDCASKGGQSGDAGGTGGGDGQLPGSVFDHLWLYALVVIVVVFVFIMYYRRKG